MHWYLNEFLIILLANIILSILFGCFTWGIKAVGGLVKGRNGSYKIKDVGSKYECQVKQCRLTTGCSHFIYIEDTKECYLKTADVLKELMHSDDRRDVTFGPHI